MLSDIEKEMFGYNPDVMSIESPGKGDALIPPNVDVPEGTPSFDNFGHTEPEQQEYFGD
jgi:hypothetical protein